MHPTTNPEEPMPDTTTPEPTTDGTPTDAEAEIRRLVTTWAKAAHDGDMAGVLADHTDDIVMFDVPPPEDGARGLDAYRATWPGFFEWQRSGARFDLVEVDVTVGADVAFVWALLRCGAEADLADHPDRRLRLTLGLRREGGRWAVAHEHHSFTDRS
jgi:uncharacterized protein (TIGR02246 family)